MKKIDKLFVVALVIVPLIVAVGLTVLLVQNDNVSPEDSSANTPTPTFDIQPLTPVVNTPTPTPTFDIQPITPTATKKPELTNKPTVTATPPDSNFTPTPSKVKPTKNPDDVDDLDELPKTDTDGKTQDSSPVAQTDADLTPAGIILVSIIIASTFGGLLTVGRVLRSKKAD